MTFNKNYFLYTIVFLSLIFSYSCSDDDDNGGGDGNGQAATYASTCCQEPHLEACVEGAMVFVPNAFTPNGDGVNDIFLTVGSSGVKEINSLKIFDEDGDMVYDAYNFHPNNPIFGWDGSSTDGVIEDGIFTYTIVIENINSVSMSFDGSVCVRVADGGEIPCVDLEKHCAYGTQHDGNGGFNPVLPTFENCQ